MKRRRINPTHLFLGTKLDNAADREAKGRGKRRPASRGENHPAAKLTAEKVIEARSLLRPNDPLYGYTGLARRYGVSRGTLYLAIIRKTWAWLGAPATEGRMFRG
jgi:hypothetical protein